MTETLRLATANDWEAIQRLNAEVFVSCAPFDPFLNVQDPYTPESVEGYKKETSDPNIFCMIAEIDGIPAGYLVGRESNFSYRTNKRGEINHMGVSPQYRGHGLGSKLIAEFKRWCQERGMTHIAVNTYFLDDGARKFYEKNGLASIDVTLEGPVS